MRRSTSVSALTVLDLHDALLELKACTAEQMVAAGLHRQRLIDSGDSALPVQEQRLDERYLLKLWQMAADDIRLPHIGLLIGQRFKPETRGILASWLFQCAHVGEALHVFQQHIALMNPSESLALETSNSTLSLEFAFAPERPYPQAAIERSMSACLRWCEEMTGQPVTPIRCEFTFARPAYHAHCTALFGSDLSYAGTRNCLHLPQTLLHAPIRGASNYLKDLLQQRAMRHFDQLQREQGFTAQVRRLIQARLRDGVHIEQVCRALHVSRPTLYRHLKQEGTSFTTLLDGIRRALALDSIQRGLPMAKISEDVGFKDVSTLHRACKRWLEQPPGQYRKELRRPPAS